ncbi:MAG TPA: HAD-IIIA family hydrolase, partial [Gemmatimonadaceae bacterium]|nr:HAD-IIIA family hydrolase [Gemmatimonadaceae bacterium]
LLPDAADSVARLNRAAIPAIIVTNQSGIGRGHFTVEDYERVHDRVSDLLRAGGARIDATYYCPHHPDFDGPCACRKPGVLLYQRAAADYGLDLARSTFIGDRWRDIAPALSLGGRGILVPSDATPPEDRVDAERDAEIAPTLTDAVTRVLSEPAEIS